MFSGLYDSLLKIYPSIQLPERPIYNYIYERYYIETGKCLEGTSFNISDNTIIVKAKDIDDFNFHQYIYNETIVDVFVIPYEIDRYSFDRVKGYSIIYNIVFEICNKYDILVGSGIKTIFKYAPFVIATLMYNDLFSLDSESECLEILNILDPDLNITVDIMYEIIQYTIEDLLDKGKILPILDKEHERRNTIIESISVRKVVGSNEYEGII